MQTTKTRIGAAVAATICLGLVTAGCGGSSKPTTRGVAGANTKSTTLVGAGSTLVAPLLTKWQGEYSQRYGVTITYGAIGSGGGIEQITSRTVDFGASDAPLSADQAKACNGCVQTPWALAATTLSYNVPGVTKPLRLSGPVIAEMYLGKITAWNDPRIAKLNKGVKLPSTKVQPVFRSDASGDTYAFTDYLSKVSPAWKHRVGGANASVGWPTGAGGNGNAGVAALIEQTRGAIGYVAIGQAIGSGLHFADVENAAGTFVRPSTKSIAAAAATAHFRGDNSASIVDPPASATTAYPISTFTYVIVSRSSSKIAALRRFLTYAVTTGQRDATSLDFAPLPHNVVAKAKTIIQHL